MLCLSPCHLLFIAARPYVSLYALALIVVSWTSLPGQVFQSMSAGHLQPVRRSEQLLGVQAVPRGIRLRQRGGSDREPVAAVPITAHDRIRNIRLPVLHLWHRQNSSADVTSRLPKPRLVAR